MSQITQPLVTLPERSRTRRAALAAALLALAAAAAVVLVLAIDGGSDSVSTPAAATPQAVQVSGGATARDGFNTAVSSQSRLSSRPSSPDESRVAASLG